MSERDPSFGLNFDGDEVFMVNVNNPCSIYSGPCEEVLVDKTLVDLYKDPRAKTNRTINIHNENYKVDVELSGNDYLKLTSENGVLVRKKYRLLKNVTPLKLIVINSMKDKPVE